MGTLLTPTKLRISLNSNSSRGIIEDITRYGRFSEENDFLEYTALGRVWYGAKYSQGVLEQFAHTFEKSDFRPEMCMYLYYIILYTILGQMTGILIPVFATWNSPGTRF